MTDGLRGDIGPDDIMKVFSHNYAEFMKEFDNLKPEKKYGIMEQCEEIDDEWAESFFSARDDMRDSYWQSISKKQEIIDMLLAEFEQFYESHKPATIKKSKSEGH